MRNALLASVAALLAACAVGPDYRTPETEAAPFVAAQTAGVAEQPFEAAWWEQFQDPVAEVDHHRRDRTDLDEDGEHPPEPAVQVQAHPPLGEEQVTGRADGEELGDAFDDAEDDRDEQVWHKVSGVALVNVWRGRPRAGGARAAGRRAPTTGPPGTSPPRAARTAVR